MTPSRSALFEALEEIIDPCSISAGAPLSLAAMGLVEDLRVDEQGAVTVRLRLTSPGCLVGPLVFEPQVRECLQRVPGVRSIFVEYGDPLSWSEDAISEEGRRKLAEARRRRIPSRPIRLHR